MHALWKKRPNKADHIENVKLHQDNAQYHTTRNALLKLDVVGFQQAIHQPYSSRIYEEHDLIIELRSVMQYKNATDH